MGRNVFALLIVAMSVVVGSYFGSAKIAQSTSSASSARTITLRTGDVAVYGNLRCLATFEGRTDYFLCSRRPRARARYEAAIRPSGINVFRMGNPDPIYSTP